ncbi:HEPN domain-containing protein [Thermosulfurimonas marina]|uniref:HEPN domain-containing protein n=1 Tax=Thermosulfurimonas marina TaxID=2047767 RepID=A0A6H1WR64_9BACT|nr:HEPN domain-containing protein [Thermosulfurimonas marina]QJA05650.1 HEPN domain-containing protein [Thermosulfurimonas marina]
MPDRSRDWFRQAEWDLAHAEKDLGDGYYEWACFSAHQAAEEVLRALKAWAKDLGKRDPRVLRVGYFGSLAEVSRFR